MAWILLLLAVVCFFTPFFTTSFVLGAVCMLAALVLVIVATMMMLSARIDGATRSAPMLTAEELRVMRELAERQHNGTAAPAQPKPAETPTQTPPTDA